MAGGGGRQGKAGQQRQGLIEQLLGWLSSHLTLVLGIGCLCSCSYVIVLLVTSHPAWVNGNASFSSLYSNRNSASLALENSSTSTRDLLTSVKDGELVSEMEMRKETSMDRIVFGIGASAKLWSNRSKFLRLWWKRGTRGYIWFDQDMGDKWIPNDPPYKVSANTSHFAYTHKTGQKGRAAIRISRIVSETFRLGLPNVDWFVMGDDDTFFFTENLVRVLSKYDPTQLWYIGCNSEDHIQNQLFSYNMAYGGGGFAISYALAKVLAETQDACIHRYPWLFGSDDRMKACMSELGVPLTKEPGFHQFDIRGDAKGFLSAHTLSPIVSIHHLEAIYPLFPNHTRAQALAHLMEAVDVSPHNIFQLSFCYDESKQFTFSVSWGYMVQVYKGFLPPTVLEVPTLTFLSWHKRRESYAFPINTRPKERDICDEPTAYFLEGVAAVDGSNNLTRSTYVKGDRLNRIRVCQEKLGPISLVGDIHVESETLGNDWIQNPRRQCCRITDFNKKSINIQVGACGEGQILVPVA